MDADVLNALKTQAAYWAGSCERPIIIVKAPAGELKSTWKKQPLEFCLEYLINSLSKETTDNGLNVIIDIQLCSWRYARNAIQYVNDLLSNKNAKLYAVRSDIFLDNCMKSQKYLNTSIVSKQRLQHIFETEELPTELGGTLSCNNEHWLKIRIRIEDFRKSLNKAEIDLDAFVESLKFLKTERQSEISEISNHRTGTCIEMQNIIKLIIKNGNKLLTELNDALNKNHCKSRDIFDAISSIKQMLNKLEQKQAEFTAIWDEFKKYISNLKKLGDLIEGINVVTKWILGTGEEMIGKQHEIGTDLQTSEILRDSHDALEIKCCETYGFYAEINYKIKRFLNEKDSMTMKSVAFKDFIAQQKFMDFLCRGFANRLERRRIILIACVRFYRLVTAYFDRTSQCFDQHIIGNKVIEFEICVDKLKTLLELKIDLEKVVRELEKEGETLSDVLSMPVKDVLGRDTGVDYSKEISMVRAILTETKNRRQIFLESAELQTLTFEQIIHIHTYERDAVMANKWIDELLSYTINTHSYVGCNIHEIQRQKQHLQKVQETAKKIFDYGNQLLEASMALRSSCKLNDSEIREKIKNLIDTWKHLDSISQEQMTRLRVSAVFHRTMEEQCQQLKELKDTIQSESESDTDDKEEKLLRLRLHLLNREQLLIEIGRMVRLGKLLRSRLKEPFSIDLINGKIENETLISASTLSAQTIAANAITGKLNEVSKIAESVDNALRETQIYLHNETNSLERKTDGNISIDSRGSTDELNSIAKLSTEDESFVTASECTLTPHSHSSPYETASEGGIMSPWWIEMDKNSFETCSSSDMDSEVPSMQLLSGVISSVTNSFYDSDHSYLSAFQSPYNSGEEIDQSPTEGPDTIDETECPEAAAEQTDSDTADVSIKVSNDDSGTFIDLTNDRSSWSLVTKHTVKGCL